MRFHRYLAALLLAAIPPLGLATSTPARASADIDCDPDVKIAHASFTRCNVMTAIGPGNDKRANLLLLLLDRDGAPPLSPAPALPADAVPLFFWKDFRDQFVPPAPPPASGFATGEGSRCLSNASGATAFAAVVAVAKMPDEDRASLIDARKALAPSCVSDPGAQLVTLDASDAKRSPAWRTYATYLRGVDAFYAGQFDEARNAFTTLHGNADAWLANTADYMVARALVNQLQQGAVFDDYGDLDKTSHVDPHVADQATASLEAYLRDHPDGSYAASARGLERRVDWLAGRNPALATAYAALMAHPGANSNAATLAEEISDKLLPSLTPAATHDPILLAVLDLAAMRAPEPIGGKAAPAQAVDLEAQRADFADAMPLFDFLAATQAFYIEHDPAKVMKLVPDDTHRHGGNHLWFARQALRGLALEAKGDRNARGFWKELFAVAERPIDRLTVQLGLAMHDERAHALDEVFAPGSIVTNEKFRATLIQNGANAALLRRQARNAAAPASERDLALTTLLWKEVTRGHYADFVDDIALVPANAATDDKAAAGRFVRLRPGDLDCPALATTAGQLAQDPNAERPRLCLAEFVRTDGASWDSVWGAMAETGAYADQLGGAPSMFPGKPYERASTYKAVIADKEASPQDRAFALYRAVLCWAPAGVNDCGGPDVPKAQRAAWYKTLKRDYSASRWAKALTYWW